MADNLTQKRPRYTKSISISQEWEARYWLKELGVTADELKRLSRSMEIAPHSPRRLPERPPNSRLTTSRGPSAVRLGRLVVLDCSGFFVFAAIDWPGLDLSTARLHGFWYFARQLDLQQAVAERTVLHLHIVG